MAKQRGYQLHTEKNWIHFFKNLTDVLSFPESGTSKTKLKVHWIFQPWPILSSLYILGLRNLAILLLTSTIYGALSRYQLPLSITIIWFLLPTHIGSNCLFIGEKSEVLRGIKLAHGHIANSLWNRLKLRPTQTGTYWKVHATDIWLGEFLKSKNSHCCLKRWLFPAIVRGGISKPRWTTGNEFSDWIPFLTAKFQCKFIVSISILAFPFSKDTKLCLWTWEWLPHLSQFNSVF